MPTAADDVVVRFYEENPFPNNLGIVAGAAKPLRETLGLSRSPQTVLDLGCGTGEELMMLREAFPEAAITAIEPSKASLAIARQRCPDVRIMNEGIESFEDAQTYDLVFCSGVLHHTKDPVANLKRVTRWMARDSRLFLGVYHHARWDCRVTVSHPSAAQLKDGLEHPREKTYSWQGFKELIRGAGLEIEKAEMLRHGIRIPVPRGRLMDAVYDGLWLYKRKQMMSAVLRLSPVHG